jgi:hypothetical protein
MLSHLIQASSRAPAVTNSCLLGLLLTLQIQGCTMLSPPPVRPMVDVTGHWEGRSFASCVGRLPRCGAMVAISLSMIQNESDISGVYRCATGNVICRNLDTEGKIAAGTIRGRSVSLRVMLEDVSSCIFNGTFSVNTASGSYICLQGGGMVERGFWKVARVAGPPPPPTWWDEKGSS